MCKCSLKGATSLSGLGLGYLGPGTLSIKAQKETCLVAEWVRIRMPMQGTQVRSLVQEDTTSCRATKPMHCNTHEKPITHTRSPRTATREKSPLAATRGSPCKATKTQCS